MTKTEEFGERFGAKVGFDFQMIIEMIMQIFANCSQSKESMQAMVKRPNIFQRARATHIVMQHTEGVSRFRARRIADDLLQEAAAMDDDTLGTIIDECCDPSRWE